MRRFLLLLALLAVVTAACSGGGTVAATVDGEDITTTEVSALVFSDPDSLDTDTFSVLLFNLIADEVFTKRAAEDFGISVTPEEFEVEKETFVQSLTSQGQTLEEVLEANDASEERLDLIVEQRILVGEINEALLEQAGPLTEDDLRAAFEEQQADLAQVCTSHILVPTEEEARVALQRVQDGEDFAAVAQELSIGPSGPDGGDLGCTPPSAFVPEFADAAMAADIGAPVGPVETQFGFHVILVNDRIEPTFEEAREQLQAQLEGQRQSELLDAWRVEVLSAADVEVDEKYGRWVTDPVPQIIPPGT